MAIVKVLEIMADSNESWEDATKTAVETASKTVKDIKSVYIQDQSAVVKDGKVVSFRVSIKISFEVK